MRKNNCFFIICLTLLYAFEAYINIAFLAALIIFTAPAFLIFKKLNVKKKFVPLAIIAPIYATILLTNEYFGIGSYGSTCYEMIRNYLSLGFHPNWSGILYGTIVMVIIITTPRKFKGKVTTLSAALFGLSIATALDIIIIRNKKFGPIREINIFTAAKGIVSLPNTDEIAISLILGILCAMLLALHFLNVKKAPESKILTALSVIFFIVALILGRMPAAALACAIITAGWQGIKIKDTLVNSDCEK